jgi:hypothetical protein
VNVFKAVHLSKIHKSEHIIYLLNQIFVFRIAPDVHFRVSGLNQASERPRLGFIRQTPCLRLRGPASSPACRGFRAKQDRPQTRLSRRRFPG